MRKGNFFIGLGLMVLSSAQVLAQTSTAWRIESAEWTQAHEARYEQFVVRIGEAVSNKVCNSVAKCMSNPAVNPYRSTDPQELKLYSDCADLPYFLRAYFAWKNQLPFGIVSDVTANVLPGDEPRDIRYTKRGNMVAERFDVITRRAADGSVKMVSGVEVLNRVVPSKIFSAIYRMGYAGIDADGKFSDFYPVRIDLKNVRPGTIVYDPAGHVVVIYKVTQDGRALFFDAHPDNSLTAGMFDAKFSRSNPAHGAGFKNWRPIRLVNATYDAKYGFVGGTLVGAKDASLPGYSMEQFYGTNQSVADWKKSEFVMNAQKLSFYDFVRHRLVTGVLRINPIDDIRNNTRQLCSTLKERVEAVQGAVTAGIHLQAHPERLPRNIFGADGDWENYASPSRDARLRDEFRQLREYVETAVSNFKKGDGSIAYSGSNFVKDLMIAYRLEADACQFTYMNSNNQPVTLNMEDARMRLYDMSFDPYHCPELRWGATDPNELASCRDDATKRAWWTQEKWMRFQHERNTEAVMNYSLQELTGPMDFGAKQGKETEVFDFLMSKL